MYHHIFVLVDMILLTCIMYYGFNLHVPLPKQIVCLLNEPLGLFTSYLLCYMIAIYVDFRVSILFTILLTLCDINVHILTNLDKINVS